MRTVARKDIVDYQTYEEQRPAFQEEVFAAKAPRRIHVGEYFTFLFENALTIRYQVQEMMRVERIVKESAIEHELRTYNSLLGEEGELGCSLLIEVEDPAQRDRLLREWLELPEHIYVRTGDGNRVRPRFDEGQRGTDRLSSVQYLVFPVEGRTPVAVGIDLPGMTVETELSEEQRAALAADLAQSEGSPAR
jgi:hypothetical protein